MVFHVLNNTNTMSTFYQSLSMISISKTCNRNTHRIAATRRKNKGCCTISWDVNNLGVFLATVKSTCTNLQNYQSQIDIRPPSLLDPLQLERED